MQDEEGESLLKISIHFELKIASEQIALSTSAIQLFRVWFGEAENVFPLLVFSFNFIVIVPIIGIKCRHATAKCGSVIENVKNQKSNLILWKRYFDLSLLVYYFNFHFVFSLSVRKYLIRYVCSLSRCRNVLAIMRCTECWLRILFVYRNVAIESTSPSSTENRKTFSEKCPLLCFISHSIATSLFSFDRRFVRCQNFGESVR